MNDKQKLKEDFIQLRENIDAAIEALDRENFGYLEGNLIMQEKIMKRIASNFSEID